jgi:hypothetical protein
MIARMHHYVPRCYLKGFSVPRKKTRQVVVFDCKSGKSFTTATENVAVERDFNRVEMEGHSPDVLETAMSGFETKIHAALDSIIAAKSIRQVDDRAYLFNLIGLLALRNPGQRKRWRDFREQVAKRIMHLATATPERWASQVAQAKAAGAISKDADTDYAKVREMVVDDGYRIEVSTEEHISKEMQSLDTILPCIFERKWALLKCQTNSGGFVTSDHPVCLMWSEPGRRGPIGFRLRGTEIVFPICSRLAIVGAFEIQEHEMDASEELVAAINGTLIQFADRHLYARDYNFHYALVFGEPPRKGSKLIDDRRLKKQAEEEE